MDEERLTRLIEFFVVGVVMGVTEDLLAVTLATDAEVTVDVMVVVVAVAIPFAILSELVVDHPSFGPLDDVAARVAAAIDDS